MSIVKSFIAMKVQIKYSSAKYNQDDALSYKSVYDPANFVLGNPQT